MSEDVRDDYLESLEELTVNSRPIIKTLTEIAQENVVDAKAVVDAIEMHCLRCPPNHKLPALYLVDSICKNIGEPYTDLLIPRIIGIFTNAFGLAPETTRVKLNELFKTWTIPQPQTGDPLFPHEILHQINDFLVRQQMAHSASMAPPPPAHSGGPHENGMIMMPSAPPVRPRLNQSALMVEMNRFRQQLENDNNDQFNERQLSLLSRLEAQISGVVDPKVLPEVQNSLEEMKVAREQYLSRPPSSNNNNRRNGGGGGGGHQNGNNRRDNRRQPNGNNGHRDRKNNGGVSKITGTNNVPLGTRKLRNNNTSTENELNAIAEDTLSPKSIVEVEAVDLATACEQPASAKLVEQLYSEGLPLQCSTCGYRFQDTPEGRAAKEAEMDWHFRANKDMREGRSRNRCWFLVASSWIAYRDEDEVFGLGSSLVTESGVMNGDQGATSANGFGAPVDFEKEKMKYTEVPLDSSVVCPICGEPHETSWSEEAENWVWMNTVEVNGLYFHATCYADPQNRDLVASLLDAKA